MAKLSTTTIAVTVTGDGVDASYAPPTTPITNAAAPAGGPVAVTLASGDNTITVPSGAIGFILVPPTGSVIVKKLKGAGGDSGFIIAPATASIISLTAATATVLLNASGIETISIHWL